MKRIGLIALFCLGLCGPAMASQAPNQAFNICALAIPLYNQYIANYEYVYNNLHGMNVRIEYVPLEGENIEGDGLSVALNYRWHIFESFDSFFVGIYTRYRVNSGGGEVDGTAFDFERPEFTAGLNAGKRWTWNNGFNMLFSLGFGESLVKESVSNRNAAINAEFSQFMADNSLHFDESFYGEFSFGYAF